MELVRHHRLLEMFLVKILVESGELLLTLQSTRKHNRKLFVSIIAFQCLAHIIKAML